MKIILRARLLHSALSREQDGFNLVELLISAVILLVTLMGAVTISLTSSMNSYQTGLRYQKEAAIDADLAQIQRFNDRFTCVSGTCLIAPGTDTPMGKDAYFPDPVGPDTDNDGVVDVADDANHDGIADEAKTALDAFQNRCLYLASLDLVTPLKQLIEASIPVPTGLQRTIAVDSTTQGGAHRYTVTYVDPASNEVMRQMTLLPSTVAWCPRI
ncbi:prepilin-type N-terminal cleavage/methylation domain-containing protein [Synechococcus sp. CS-1328]|uniref:type IV pilus modification PilV family protein n=1 Tax=Synechococcus sp. CS-1328 TaxID=2847976 RepID=UPI00223B1057|nr:prepilin-type N-terminal cleavage/methylation domain-containing protein [Synechococcus sp. CS-1328]MCT0224848.1 prepilin-type N-terminal cleavage/methylation domain-containing protein [Synechococcus sp. CS-1328]